MTNVETEEGRRLKESLVKQLTGGDRISARRMREDPWNFWPTHTLFMATNHRPEIKGTDNAIRNRIKPAPFELSIPKGQQDRKLPDKLRDELPGILAWAVQGHMEWLNNGLQEPEEVKAATNSYRNDMDTLARFIDEECETTAGLKVKSSTLYNRYRLWCEESGEQVMRSQDFSNSLQDRGYSRGKSNGDRVYKGISVLSQPSTTGPGAHEADENHNSQENDPRENKQNRVPPSAPADDEPMPEEVEAVAETIKELYDEYDTHRFTDDRELHRTLLFRRLIPEDVTIATVEAAREMLA